MSPLNATHECIGQTASELIKVEPPTHTNRWKQYDASSLPKATLPLAHTLGVVLAFLDGVSSAAGSSATLFTGLFLGVVGMLCYRGFGNSEQDEQGILPEWAAAGGRTTLLHMGR